MRLWLCVIAIGLASLGLVACGSRSGGAGGSASRSAGTTAGGDSQRSGAAPAGLQGLSLSPVKPAPALALRNYTGGPVNISQFRGKAVLVTFVYTRCPNVCPVIVSSLAAAHRALGPAAARVQMVAVTVDPWHDSPAAIRSFLAARGATGAVYYLVGALRQLIPVWKAWDVGVTISRTQVLAGHTAIVYGITASGRLVDAYPANFTPAQIVHDVPLLARS